MNKKIGRIRIYISVFIITAGLYSWILYYKIGRLEFKPEPAQYIMDIERTDINYGDSMDACLSATRLSDGDKTEIKKELKALKYNIGKIKAGDFFEIVYSRASGQWTDFWYYPEGELFYSIKKESDGTIVSSLKTLGKISARHNISGTINSSLWEAMASKGVPAGIILSFADIFAWKMDFLTDTRKGDTFRVIYDVETISKKNIPLSSQIIAAQYISGKKPYNAVFFKTSAGTSGYFDDEGGSVKSAFLKAPLQFRRISSYFTTARKHPILKYVRPHLGIDYAAPTGTPISSIADGTVTMAKYNGGFGNYVEVKHANGYVTGYGHLSKYARGIKKGVRVNQGQVIGYVGSTGLSTGPHLDFRIKKNGKFFNFLTMKQPPTTALHGEDKKAFNTYKEKILLELAKPADASMPSDERETQEEPVTELEEQPVH